MKTVIKDTTVGDKLLFLLLVAASVAGIFISREALPQGSGVIIEVNGRPEYTFPLDKDTTVAVPGPAGNTLVEIRKGKVRVKEASCPNKLCEKQGWVTKGVIVCLPNHIVITVGGKTDTDPKGVDAVTG